MTEPSIRRVGTALRIGSAIAVVFGLLTVVSGGRVLFGGEPARQAAGDYVPFVLWFNFLAGFVYVAAGAGLWLGRGWARWLAVGLAVATLGVFAAFGLHVLGGGTHEARTVGAMLVRSLLWCALAWMAVRSRARSGGGRRRS